MNTENTDASQEFLDSLPELGPTDTFLFACGPEVPCFNCCCAELTLPLTPYDVLRLTQHLEIDSERFLNSYTQLRTFPDTGFPLPLLKMQEGPGEPCPFVSPAGCRIYEDRPGACRCYPLGRATSVGENDTIAERFFLVQEPHCHGFDTGRHWTPKEWLANQETEPYNLYNDKYMRLMAMVKASGKPLESRMSSMAVLCLFQLDKFREFITNMHVFKRVSIPEERQKAILEQPEATLDFAFDWMELILFGQSPTLQKT